MTLGFVTFLALCCIKWTNGLQITMEDTIILGQATTINYVSGSNDPSQWLLRNVYANGTTQIGGVQSGTGSVSFSFQLAGPHFLQAVAYNDTTSTATSQPFYTGNLFTPVNTSSTTSSSTTDSSTAVASAVPSASCPTASPVPSTSSAETSSSSSDSSNAGAIAGEVIGALGFLAALIFFGLWFRLYRQQYKKPNYGQTFIQTTGPSDGNGLGVVLTPVVVTPHNGQAAPTQRIASWVRRLYRPSKYLDEEDMKEVSLGRDTDTTRSMR
ncbi:hypothetical protein EV361DRAFT_137710 [Lentinula raphanica]|uniref:Uncharacterized protein n=1 Tax=Lentinula raphanica TaxID=153919 RepID=A0AA38UJX7_9AGAR|nr:hypothetical protein F5880DRAFT_89504 [Lentinula raphanica]KAJ3841232.1 hypothetical protein F5878DRAFT_610865 [Lentinula raphanica]KAJ3972476.1 hypothetical protein EV361DRAFT_137710 [Lentinula raphanica]